MKNREIQEKITAQIVADIQSGNIEKWIMPWTSSGGTMSIPTNARTKKQYRGINTFILWFRQSANKYKSSEWVTFKQANELGGHILRGEKATDIVFWSQMTIDEEREEEEGNNKRWFLKVYKVFNLCQTSLYKEEEQPEKEKVFFSDSKIDKFIELSGAKIEHGGDAAFFSPWSDYIGIPNKSDFHTRENYYATLFHELTHWTAPRVKRELGKTMEGYAKEELVAELGSSYLCAFFGVRSTALQHRDYIASWLKSLQSDCTYIFKAASKAQEAFDYLTSKQVAKAA